MLKARCWACHGALKQEGGLRLDTAEFARKGGEDGLVLVPGKPGGSELVRRVQAKPDDGRMPPEGQPLTGDQISLLSRWISAGATGPADEKPAQEPRTTGPSKSPHGGPPPRVADARALEPDRRLSGRPNSIAASNRRPRRTSPSYSGDSIWDLIGLPPTADELHDFSTTGPDAYERVVERLLANPHHGERWGRHWMDIWRYSDWWGLGAEVRNARSTCGTGATGSSNRSTPTRATTGCSREMLAADEIVPDRRERLRATGYLVRNYYHVQPQRRGSTRR